MSGWIHILMVLNFFLLRDNRISTFVDEPGLTFHLLSRALGVNLLGREGNSQIGDRMQITEVQIYNLSIFLPGFNADEHIFKVLY